MERLIITQKEQRMGILLNQNTQIYLGRKFFNIPYSENDFPQKIQDRLNINLAGLNSLATTNLPFQIANQIEKEDLEEILNFSNNVNRIIGLPQTESLIIRSSTGGSSIKYEPALLIQNLKSQNPKLLLLEGDNKKYINSHRDFLASLPVKTCLLIHDDNEVFQTHSVHVRLHENNNGCELFLGTDVLHSRELENPDKLKPSIMINYGSGHVISHYKIKNLFYIPQAQIKSMLINGVQTSEIDKLSIRLRNINESVAQNLIEIVLKNAGFLMEVHEIAQEMKGDFVVTEFRIYPTLPKGIAKSVQLLDIDI